MTVFKAEIAKKEASLLGGFCKEASNPPRSPCKQTPTTAMWSAFFGISFAASLPGAINALPWRRGLARISPDSEIKNPKNSTVQALAWSLGTENVRS